LDKITLFLLKNLTMYTYN